MTGDRRLYELLEKGIVAITQLSENVEKLVSEPPMMEVEEPTPPQCPHCRAVNPHIMVPASEPQRGNLIQYVLNPTCVSCRKPFWVLFTGWAVYATREAARKDGQILVDGMMGRAKHERSLN